MAVSPYSSFFVTSEWTIAVSGGSIHVLNTATGETISSKSIDEKPQTQSISKGPIVAATVNEESTYLLTVGENKILTVWQLPNLESVNERELPKKPTGLAFTQDSQTILVSDKFGDVFSYALRYVIPTAEPLRDEFSSHENPSDGQLVLGHASPLNTFLLSHDQKYIITADRDEHIRVSWYPQGYNIEMYCLGHRKYVSAIHIPIFANDVLISGGGDPSLRIWNWMSGKCTAEVQVWDIIKPFITVKKAKWIRGGDEQDGEDGLAQKRKGKGKKSKKRAAKRATRAKKDDTTEHDEEIKNSPDEDDDAEHKEGVAAQVAEEAILVVSKISSVRQENRNFVIFSAVGATALFGFQFPDRPIMHFDFGHPVIDFASDVNGKIWVSLDTRRISRGTALEGNLPVRVVEFVTNEKLVEVTSIVNQTLLNTLKDKGITGIIRLLGTVAHDVEEIPEGDEKVLDFYADLKGMPKWSEPSANAAAAEDDYDALESVSSSTTPKPPTKREEARMKNKKNVLAKMQQLGERSKKEKPGFVRSFENVEADDGEVERQQKRAKSDVESSRECDIDEDMQS